MKANKIVTPKAYRQNALWAEGHATEIHSKYEGKWVAVADRQVVAVGDDPVRVRELAARRTGHTTGAVFVEYIESAGAIYGTHWTLVQDSLGQ
jgi:hypothetical protein